METDAMALVQQIPLFADLPAEQLGPLVSTLQHRSYRKGELILCQGDAGDSLFIVATGRVRIYTLSSEGHELSVWLCDAGDFFGEMALLTGEPRSAFAEAMEPTQVWVLHRREFHRYLLSNPTAAVRIIETLSRRLRCTTESIEGLLSLSVSQRIARKLLDLAERYGVADEQGVLINLDLPQEAIAALVGTTRESANRALSALRDQGLIKMSRGRVYLLDRARLQALVDCS